MLFDNDCILMIAFYILSSGADSLRFCCLWFQMSDCRFFCGACWIFTEVVFLLLLKVLLCYVAGAAWNCCHLGTFCVHCTAMHHVISNALNPALICMRLKTLTCDQITLPGHYQNRCSADSVSRLVSWQGTRDTEIKALPAGNSSAVRTLWSFLTGQFS